MYYLLARLRGPLYSVKRLDVYQVSTSYPFIPPSTLIGALGEGLGILGYCEPSDCLNYAKKLVRKAREVFLSDVKISVSPVILKRARGVLENESLPGSFNEITKYNDALVREYTYSFNRQVLFGMVDGVDVVKKALYNIQRLGDTESMVSVEDVKEVEVEKCDKHEVNVVSDIKNATGRYLIFPAFDEQGKRRYFSVPLYFLGSYYEVGEIKYNRTLCAGEAIFPEGDDW